MPLHDFLGLLSASSLRGIIPRVSLFGKALATFIDLASTSGHHDIHRRLNQE